MHISSFLTLWLNTNSFQTFCLYLKESILSGFEFPTLVLYWFEQRARLVRTRGLLRCHLKLEQPFEQ
jgi:hypothetical protein